MRRLLIMTLLASVMFAGQLCAMTFYVDVNQTTNTEDGITWATAFDRVKDAVSRLAATNALTQGGHVVLVANGEYATVANKDGIYLNDSHSGLPGASNYIRAVNVGGVEMASYGVQYYFVGISGGSNMVIDGIRVRRNNASLRWTDGRDCLIRNCELVDSGGIQLTGGIDAGNVLDHCLIYDQSYGLYYEGLSPLTVRNSIIVDCGKAGVIERYSNRDVHIVNSCLFANGADIQMMNEGSTLIRTEEELNNVDGCSNNYVRNPGFAGTDWSCNRFYTNSVCLGTATDGGNMGPIYSSWIIWPTSTNTYYVDPVSGSDARSKEQAQNRSTAWKTMEYAASQLYAGNTVIVLPGTETHKSYPDIEIDLTRGGSYDRVAQKELPVTFRAETLGTVILECSYNCFEVAKKHGGYVFDGFVFKPGQHASYYWSGVTAQQSFDVTVSNCVSYGGSAGFDAYEGYGCTVEHCTVSNTTRMGIRGYSTIRYCNIYNNLSHGIQVAQTALIENCMIHNNNGRGIYSEAKLLKNINGGWRCDNCTIHNNGGHGIFCDTGAHYQQYFLIQNCIISDNGGYGLYYGNSSTPKRHGMRYRNCCFTNNASGNYYDAYQVSSYNTEGELNSLYSGWSNSIVNNPQFLDAANTNLMLHVVSPCINAGRTPTWTNSTDYFGNPRLSGKYYDIGCHEYQWPGGTVFLIM